TTRSASWRFRLARNRGKSTCRARACASLARIASSMARMDSQGPAATHVARTSTAASRAAVHVLVFIGSELQVQRSAEIVDERRQRRKVALDFLSQARPGHGRVVQRPVRGEVAPPQVVDPFEIGGEAM